MSLADYQKQVDDLLKPYEKPYWHPLSQLAHIAEEVGEVARILNHHYGDKPKKATEELEELESEVADVLFSLICLANSEHINLDEALKKAMDKHENRDKDRFPKKQDM